MIRYCVGIGYIHELMFCPHPTASRPFNTTRVILKSLSVQMLYECAPTLTIRPSCVMHYSLPNYCLFLRTLDVTIFKSQLIVKRLA